MDSATPTSPAVGPRSSAEPSPSELLLAWNGMDQQARAVWLLRMDQETAARLVEAMEQERVQE